MLELQKFGGSDFDQLINWIPNERFLLQWAGPLLKWPLNEAQLDKHLEETKGNKPKRYAFKAVRISDNKVIGHIEVDFINYDRLTGMLSRVLIGDPKDCGKGYGTEMIKLAVDFGFKKIFLSEIHLGVFDFNKPAISCYRKIGFKECDFKQEYNLKEEDTRIRFKNEYWQDLMMKLKKDDYVRNFRG